MKILALIVLFSVGIVSSSVMAKGPPTAFCQKRPNHPKCVTTGTTTGTTTTGTTTTATTTGTTATTTTTTTTTGANMANLWVVP